MSAWVWVAVVDLVLVCAVGVVLSAWPKMPACWKRCAAVAVVVLPLYVVIYNLVGWDRPKPPPRIGVLHPRFSHASPITDELRGQVDFGTEKWVTGLPDGATAQPLGPLVPFSIRKSKGGLLISAVLTDLDDIYLGCIYENEWKVSDDPSVRWRSDGSAFEVVDKYDVPILQVEYVNPNTFRLRGVFKILRDSTCREYTKTQFPSEDSIGRRYRMFTTSRPGWWVLGATTLFGWPDTADWRTFLADAKADLPPWLPR
jgi:hypothetical protein